MFFDFLAPAILRGVHVPSRRFPIPIGREHRTRRTLRSNAIVAIVAVFSLSALVGSMFSFSPASAQPPSEPANPNWCPGVTASPPPPHFDPEHWSTVWARCTNHIGFEEGCFDDCQGARALWYRQQNGTLDQTPSINSTDQPQGPFPLPGGGSGYLMLIPSSPSAEPRSISSQSFAVPAAAYFAWSRLESRNFKSLKCRIVDLLGNA